MPKAQGQGPLAENLVLIILLGVPRTPAEKRGGHSRRISGTVPQQTAVGERAHQFAGCARRDCCSLGKPSPLDQHQPIAVMFDRMDPQRAGRRSIHLRRLAWFDEAGGWRTIIGEALSSSRVAQLRQTCSMVYPKIKPIAGASTFISRASALTSPRPASVPPALGSPACSCWHRPHDSFYIEPVSRLTGWLAGWVGTGLGD